MRNARGVRLAGIATTRLAPGGPLVDVPIDGDGRWGEPVTAGGLASGGDVLDADGRATVPGLVDAHVHLDKVYLLDELDRLGLAGGSLADAIAATRSLRSQRAGAVDAMVARAERALGAMTAAGTTAARVHVELDPAAGLEPVVAQVELAERWRDRIDLQLVAFPQYGLEAPGTEALLLAALDAGCQVVGACPYVDEDPDASARRSVALAAGTGRPLDLHLDFSDDPGEAVVDVVLDEVAARSLEGRVTVGHLTSLAAAAPDDRRRRIAALAATRTTVVSLPATDLYLNGRGAHRPPARGVTPLGALLAAGVPVALGTNNVQNAFTPAGSGSILPIAWLALLAGHLGTTAQHAAVLAWITSGGAAALGFDRREVVPGAVADGVVLASPDPLDAVRATPGVVAVVRRGRLVETAMMP